MNKRFAISSLQLDLWGFWRDLSIYRFHPDTFDGVHQIGKFRLGKVATGTEPKVALGINDYQICGRGFEFKSSPHGFVKIEPYGNFG